VVKLFRNIQVFIKSKGGVTPQTQRALKQQRALGGESERTSTRIKMGSKPNFVIIGAQKCGTTFLYHLLGQHPRVEPAAKKEIHYFDHHFDKGLRWYRSHFPTTKGNKQKTITGESSPYYLFHPLAPARVARILPDARLIVVLRNPVDRAYSHYHQEARRGHELLTFEQAIETEEARLRGEKEKMLEDEHYTSFNHQYFSYLSRGIYVEQLIEWSKYFAREQILVLKSEELYERAPKSLTTVFKFLGLPEWEPKALEPLLKGHYPPMDRATKRRLEEYFKPYNRRLYEYLGVDFGW
jgi:hypothetical protein